MTLTLVAHIFAKAEYIDLVKAELLKLIAPTRAEAGCINYDLHQDDENPSHFMFFENWESRELWQDHMSAKHLAIFQNAIKNKVERLELYEMTRMEP